MSEKINIQVLQAQELEKKLSQRVYAAQKNYYGFYSSWWEGLILDPKWMMIPVDDHMVHRGDGVFEALKFVFGKCYLINEHVDRLFSSAQKIGIQSPYSKEQIIRIIESCLESLSKKNPEILQQGSLIRIFLSRGPGQFSPNPYDSISPQLYIAFTRLQNPAREKYEQGVKLGLSEHLAKVAWQAQIKSCNYLPNVLMKKEAVDKAWDFSVALTESGYVTEGSTENIAILDEDSFLVHPPFDYILRGTTMVRIFELAKKMIKSGKIHGTKQKNLTVEDLKKAKEIFVIGTTLDVLPVRDFAGRNFHDFSVAKELLQLLREDMNKE